MEAQSGSYWRSVPLEDFMRGFIWLALALLLLFAWIGSFVMYHVAGFLIHLLLIFALISLVIHLLTGRRVTRRSAGRSPRSPAAFSILSPPPFSVAHTIVFDYKALHAMPPGWLRHTAHFKWKLFSRLDASASPSPSPSSGLSICSMAASKEACRSYRHGRQALRPWRTCLARPLFCRP